MSNPTVNPAILISPVEDGYVAYDPVADQLHQLNPLAALITELCDGSRSTDEIRQLVAPLVPEDKSDEIDRWIEQASKAGLLLMNGGEGAIHRELTGPELYKIASRLRDYGKAQPAYLCLKRAVELNPEDWDSWYYLGDAALTLGRRGEARDAYQKYFVVHPEDAEIEHLLVALRDDAPPPRAPDRTIQCIYKDFADHYESLMCKDLEYQGPERIQEGIKAVIGEARDLDVLDLGCGSGLSGVALKPFAARLTGLDLSPEMLALAKARNIYDRLEVAEITEWLEQTNEYFDLIAVCDCLIYFGDLHRIVAAAAKRLRPGGIFAMSMERGDRYPFRLTDTGRYEHHPDHVREAASAADLAVARLEEAFLRLEYGARVTGIYAVLQKRPNAS
jgi:predicted TPR repeat methyltransferase